MKSDIIDSGANLSDHLPICIEVKCEAFDATDDRRDVELRRRFRWDKVDIWSYYHTTYNLLSQIPISDGLLDCLKQHSCSAQYWVDYVFDYIVNALSSSAEAWDPRTKPGFFKVWWNDGLSELKHASIEAHKLWKVCGRPKQG